MENYSFIPKKDRQESNRFILYPIQKCPNCDGKKEYAMSTTDDGNRTQKCLSCNWTWSVDNGTKHFEYNANIF